MTILYDYQNGNCRVILHDDGSKERSWIDGEFPKPEFPESIDLKITNYCLQKCRHCHESSTKAGKHASVNTIFRVAEDLSSGVEIAIGGGNPLDHPLLNILLETLTKWGLVPNLTVHGTHVMEHSERLREFQAEGVVHGVGVSDPGMFEMLVLNDMLPDHAVCHAVMGVDNPFDVVKIRANGNNVLVLGYKAFGRGIKFFNDNVSRNIAKWKYFIGDILRESKGILSFDNLALKQLDIKNLVSEEIWSNHYMGDDGVFTMYFDAVLNQYAVSSTSPRQDAGDMNIQQMFQNLKLPGTTREE